MPPKLTLTSSNITWYPASVRSLENHLGILIRRNTYFSNDEIIAIKKNLAYSLQYIEFLDRVEKDINLSNVLWTQNVKTFFVYGVSILEALFDYLVISNGYGNTTEWEFIKKTSANYKIGNKNYKNDISILQKMPQPELDDMTFDQLAKKVESNKLLGLYFAHYSKIKRIRKLRNKIHIQDVQDSMDTDWWNFNSNEYDLVREVLRAILISRHLFPNSSHRSMFNYLR